MGICEGNANSEESIFKYIYETCDKMPSKEEAKKLIIEGLGKWIKKDSQWIWLVKKRNTEILSQKNSIKKIAQKRAFVGAIVMAAAASDIFGIY